MSGHRHGTMLLSLLLLEEGNEVESQVTEYHWSSFCRRTEVIKNRFFGFTIIFLALLCNSKVRSSFCRGQKRACMKIVQWNVPLWLWYWRQRTSNHFHAATIAFCSNTWVQTAVDEVLPDYWVFVGNAIKPWWHYTFGKYIMPRILGYGSIIWTR